MKRIKMVVSVILSVALVFIMVGCGASSSSDPGDAATGDTTGDTASDTAGDTAGDTKAPAGEPEFVFTFADYNPEENQIGKFEKEAFAYIESESGGRIKIDPYWNGTLLEAGDTWAGTGEGLADISFYYITLTPGVQSVGEIFTQYYTYKAPNMVDMLKGYRQVLDEIPEIQEEANKANLEILDVLAPSGGVYAMTKDRDIKTPADMKGMTVMAQGRYNDVLPKVGASGISLPPSEWYTSLERGVIDALSMNWSGIRAFGIEEMADYYVTFGDNGGLYCGGQAFLMNLDKWNKLPEDLQKIVRDGFRLGNDGLAAYDSEDSVTVAKEVAATEGKVVHHIDEADMAPWYELAQQSADLWIADITKKGYDGKTVWDKFTSIMESV
ncbi:MAG: TRAP transporter substrate-binding protein DctP [Clostridiales Family XIII bacterium]|jgi:TRAP-type C4-dicarboxylate transport system substrate-binding protein|nr:TRAP transporter substrate-binding protein DctP [Clostridiales Family XIII bacterium]